MTFLQIDPTAAGWPEHASTRAWIEANDSFRRDVLGRLEAEGPLTSRQIPDTAAVPWASTGWTNNRNVTQMLECLLLAAQVAISGRVGRERVWDLASRVYPAAARRWGYFALPVLHGDELVGKVDAKADRMASVLRVNAIHQDVPFARATVDDVRTELEELAAWLGMRDLELPPG